ncbi:hypothetical protein ABHC52_10770, partial [Ruminococcus bicirculans (ex Wegman et al. 2014)]|uniref:hypothetical protein n=1 Tax=Ruminococcus bicirculans (ex Wegman et al. 2014) TaxID=1160721 RepID=UPI00325B23FA
MLLLTAVEMHTGANIDKIPRITYLSTASHISLKNSCIKTENATIMMNGSNPETSPSEITPVESHDDASPIKESP